MSIDYNETRQAQLHLYNGLEDYPCPGEKFLIQGPSGVLEADLVVPDKFGDNMPISVICHPHPLHGGSMSNKVVHIIASTFTDMGLPTLRFNFRGVGHSQGRFDQGKGEVEDLQAAVAWLRQRYPDAPLWLAGFSFGAYVACKAHTQVGAQRLLLVAPPVTMYDFDSTGNISIPWMVLQGGKDDVIAPQQVSMWVHRQANRPSYHWMSDADHFFHGRLNRIRDAIQASWKPHNGNSA